MPELPEVETLVRDLRPLVIGQTIEDVQVHWERTIARPAGDSLRACLCGQRIVDIGRRGKFVIMHLERGDLLVHLRMTGRLLVVPKNTDHGSKHVRVTISLDSNRLVFEDARKFGRIYLVPAARDVVGSLGPEPLDDNFTPCMLAERLGGRRAVKTVLLDQHVVAGLGNIYADETLHAAGIAPTRPANSLSTEEVKALWNAMRSELNRGIRNHGTTISTFSDASGRAGEHQQHLRVYQRAGQPCSRCGASILRQRIGGRSSYYCPRCQH